MYAGSIPTSASIRLQDCRCSLCCIGARLTAGSVSRLIGEQGTGAGSTTARVAELVDAADSSGSPAGKPAGSRESNSGKPSQVVLVVIPS